MKKIALVSLLVGCSNNEPQYVLCTTAGPAAMDVCKVDAGMDDGTGMLVQGKASIHVPLLPEDRWSATDREQRMAIQRDVDKVAGAGAVVVPVYRLEHYDLSIEWVVRNLDTSPGQFRIDLNGANEQAAYDPTVIMYDEEEEPPPPPLAGNIPIDIGSQATVSGVFREDQLREAAIDLDQITRGNINMYAATLMINKQSDSFQPVTPIDATVDPPTGGDPIGPAVPKEAWRNITRVDLTFKPDRAMELEINLRVREHTDIIPAEGLNADPMDLFVFDPPVYQAMVP
jgi:hypothetical protein